MTTYLYDNISIFFIVTFLYSFHADLFVNYSAERRKQQCYKCCGRGREREATYKEKKKSYKNKEDRLAELWQRYNSQEYSARQMVAAAGHLVVPGF